MAQPCDHKLYSATSTMVLSRVQGVGFYCGICGWRSSRQPWNAGDDWPLLKGGQGRSEDDIEGTGVVLWVVFALFLAVMALTIAVVFWQRS